ncbi:MAG: hypothetical protein QM737_10840 [Ferruginibacter sp.]
MKKYSAFIFLPFILALAFINAGFTSIEKSKITTSQVSKLTDHSNEDVDFPNAEIEHANVIGGWQVQSGLQRTAACFNNDITGILFFAFVPLPAQFSGVESFGNNNLSYNYPAHNFW